jgi:deazaflavin-dependent oxidoreductase (nitroreductase family)
MGALLNLFVATHVRVYRASSGKLGSKMDGQPLVLLTTVGRKTGARRTVPLMVFDDGDGHDVIIASAGGNLKHPAWFNNLTANAEVTIEKPGRKYDARASVVTGERRAAIWKKVVAAQSRFDGYQTKAGAREIPVVVLEEIAS